jgi:hypothetical protein
MDGEDLAWSESLKLLTAASAIWATSARNAEGGTRTPTVTVLVNLKRHIKLGRSPLILPERPGRLANEILRSFRRPGSLAREPGSRPGPRHANRYPNTASPTRWSVTSNVFASSRANFTAWLSFSTRSASSLTRWAGSAPLNLVWVQ